MFAGYGAEFGLWVPRWGLVVIVWFGLLFLWFGMLFRVICFVC